MDVAMKLDFESCDDEENISIHTLSSGCDDGDCSGDEVISDDMVLPPPRVFSPKKGQGTSQLMAPQSDVDSPPYKRIRALKLFDSPATPKTIIEKSTTESKLSQCRPVTRPRLFHSLRSKLQNSVEASEECDSLNSSVESDKKEKEAANINPFTPTGMLLSSRKRPRSRRSAGMESPSEIVLSGTPDDVCFGDDCCEDEEEYCCGTSDDESSQPTKRLALRQANVSRYHEEFLEMSLIGQGQFGSVYKCRHRLDGCVYAVKKSLKPVAGSVNERIALNEVYAHAVLGKHPYVVRYYSAWAENNHMIIQNEYCNGGSLADLIDELKKRGRRLSENQLKQVLVHVAKGLKYIHSLHLVHLDIKPANIFISREPKVCLQGEDSADDGFEEEPEEFDDEVTYKIGDLGHVTSIINPQVEEGDCRYLPKEILQDDFTQLQKADIFALGLALYEAAHCCPLPLNGDEWHNIRNGNLENISGFSVDFQELLKEMVHPDPTMRPTALQLVNHTILLPPLSKSHAQLRRELNVERLKNEILSRQLQEAAKCLQSITPNVASYAAAVASGVLAGVAPMGPKSGLHKLPLGRMGPITRNSRLVGKKTSRSVSANNV